MSKIVQAINAMIASSHKITNVTNSGGEYFFLYDGKHKWSMAHRDDAHWLWFYPGGGTLEALAHLEGHEWEDVPVVTYKDSEIGTREARASFSELYTIVKEKLFGVNEILDEIIGAVKL